MSSQSSEDEAKKIIVELDRAYQDAVKNNDAKTMERILAHDFVLVTGKGKTFSKEDLLKEAASASAARSASVKKGASRHAATTKKRWAVSSDLVKPLPAYRRTRYSR
jgi:Domain of unknown function (DUF4440)